MKTLNISFDFDSTLALNRVQRLLMTIDRSKARIFIVTSRNPTDEQWSNLDLKGVASQMDISEEDVYFTSGMPKAPTLNAIGAHIHFDDMPEEIAMINARCLDTLGVLVTRDIFLDMKHLDEMLPDGVRSIQMDLFE